MKKVAKKNKKSSHKKIEEKEFDLPEGLELLEGNGWGSRAAKWIKNNFSAIILPIIALIILGGGIYLYSQQKGEGLDLTQKELETGITTIDLGETESITETEPAEEEELNKEEPATQVPEEEVTTVAGQDKEDIVVSQIDKNIYQEKADSGEGITHLARKALKEYLSDKNLKLTAEHKIFIEDYMQNRTGTRSLSLNEEVTFSHSLIEEAIGQAQQLTDLQLHNLEQYSHLVPSLN
ncbi:hypothetical protein D4R86_03570 [bacterium]|nr:MAG: hypothetical protein D4R86_03570 [bacterium]